MGELRGRGRRLLWAVFAAWAASGAVGAAADTLQVLADSPHSELHVTEAGHALAVRVALHDSSGRPYSGQNVRLRSLAVPSPFSPTDTTVATNLDGQAIFSLRVRDVPGDWVLVASRAGDETELTVPVRVLPRGWVRQMVVTAAGGLAMFLFGMRLIGRSLEKFAGARLRDSLGRMTSNPLRATVFGMVSTLLVQSSSASTVLLVSFASTGLLSLRGGLGAVLGAAVGSTLTVQLIAFRLSNWALLLVAIGFLMNLQDRSRLRRLGSAVIGLGLVFHGLTLISEALSPLDGMGPVVGFFVAAAENPLPAMFAAAAFTAVAQASAATLGIVLGLSLQGLLPLDAALPFVLGANVGTTTTALIAAIGAPADGRRIAWAHAMFRLGGGLLFLPFLHPFATFVEHLTADPARQVAHAFTLLNVATALVFLPFLPAAERLFRRLIPDDPGDADDDWAPRSLDRRFREQPDIAIAGALQEVLRMAQLVKAMLDDVKRSLRKDDEELAQSIRRSDDRVDRLDEAITAYLTELNTEALSGAQASRVLDLLFITKDLELIADVVSKGLVPGMLHKKRTLGLRFSDEGFHQILDFHDQVRETVELVVAAIATWNADTARRVLDRKSQLDRLERQLRVAHLARLQAGNAASRATTTVHVDAVADYKRILSYAARMAYAVLGKAHDLPEPPPFSVPENGPKPPVGPPSGSEALR
ncbi:MAG: Na/Pi cotransporter family protein [bacterium]